MFHLISSPCVGADEEKIDGGDGERRQKKILSIGKIPTESVWRVSEEQPPTPTPSRGHVSFRGSESLTLGEKDKRSEICVKMGILQRRGKAIRMCVGLSVFVWEGVLFEDLQTRV